MFGTFVLAIATVAILLLVARPLTSSILAAQYRRLGYRWLVNGQVNSNLATFVRGRYKRIDSDGNVTPLACDSYAHVFRTSGRDDGSATFIRFEPIGNSLTTRQQVSWLHHSPLRLREDVFRCVDRWRDLFIDASEESGGTSTRTVAALARYKYRVTFETPEGSEKDQLVFVFTDSLTGESYRFPLEDYCSSPWYGVDSIGNAAYDPEGPIERRLLPHWLRRASTDPRRPFAFNVTADDILSTTRDNAQVRNVDPCWNEKLEQARTGDFDVDPFTYSSVYLRGLQIVTRDEIDRDPDAAKNLRSLYWRCSWLLPGNKDDVTVNQRPILGRPFLELRQHES